MIIKKKMYAVETVINGNFIQMRAFIKSTDAKKYSNNFEVFRIIQKKLYTSI
jgi:hypothetical protein